MSIGEVLAVLKPEFPDVSVSKIRFLESEGLIEPERTPSGYRKFYTPDLERLRAILKMQRESFLPLKVIRERLAAGQNGSAAYAPAAAAPSPAAAPAPQQPHGESPAPPPPAAPVQPEDDLFEPAQPVHLTESDLADAAELDLSQVRALREYGVVCEHSINGGTYFDGDDLHVGRIAGEMLKLGIEPRHLKTLRRFAEQEASLFEQLVTPGMRNRRPEARRQATETVGELARLARRLRQAYVRQSLRAVIDGDR